MNILAPTPFTQFSGCVKLDIHFSLRNYGSPLFSGPPLHRDTVWTKQSYSLPIDTILSINGRAVKSMLVRKAELYRHIPYSDTIWGFDLTQIAKPSVNGWKFLINLDRPNINKLRFIYGSDIDLPHTSERSMCSTQSRSANSRSLIQTCQRMIGWMLL